MAGLLSLTQKQWLMPDHDGVRSLQELLAALLRERGITPRDHAAPEPAAIPDMGRAVERIRRAVEERERVGIFGDYDCDGITAAAELIRFFRRRGAEPLVRLPHRKHDGYGLNAAIVEELHEARVRLLITVDTGITAVEEIRLARDRGMDVIVTDHHCLPPELPPALALLHPALAPAFPGPHPSGAGVALLLLHALEGGRWEERETDVALAAIGTVADLVPLRGWNRALVREGLAALGSLRTGPLALLREQAGLGREVTSADIAFRIAPRLNAAGRMADPSLALRALLEGGDALPALEEHNSNRQEITEELYREILRQCQLDPELPGSAEDLPLIAAASERYPHGIIGLLAGRLTEAFGKPSMVCALDGDLCTASLRSPPSYHVTEGLERCRGLLLRFGGHAQAAGCTCTRDAFPLLAERLAEDIRRRADPRELLPTLRIDTTLDPRDISLPLCRAFASLEPFGMGNPEPRFLLRNIRMEHGRRVGGEGHHLQGRIAGFKAIGFRLGHLAEHAGQSLDAACRIGIDTWQGTRAPQIFLDDLRLAVPSPVLAS